MGLRSTPKRHRCAICRLKPARSLSSMSDSPHGVFSNQRPLVGAREIAAGRYQKRRASHRRIDDAEIEDTLGRRVGDEWIKRATDNIVGQRLWRVEGACRLAPIAAAPKQNPACVSASLRRPARSRARSRTPHRAVRRQGRDSRSRGFGFSRSATVVVDNPSNAFRAISSSTAHDSAIGARDGENRRPLKAGTTSVPARQPRCASRAIA